jgi:hypothetical protein
MISAITCCVGTAILWSLTFHPSLSEMPTPASAKYAAVSQTAAQTSAIDRLLVGTWQLIGDAKFTRTFAADGTATDRYQGDPTLTTTATWRLFTNANRDPALDSVAPGKTYMKIDSPKETLFFVVVQVNQSTLQLQYADRAGHVMKFRRTRESG